MKRLLIALLLVSTPLFAQATRDAQKKASRQTVNVETLTADKTLTYLDAETQFLTPNGADRTVTLPSTNVWAGLSFRVEHVGSANSLVMKSGDGDVLASLAPNSRYEMTALRSSPTDGSHWYVVFVSASGTFPATFAQAGGYVQAVTVQYSRVGASVTLKIPAFKATATANSAITAASALPSWLTPATSTAVMVNSISNTTYSAALMAINNSGNISLYRNPAGESFVSGTVDCGLLSAFSVSYNVQ